MSERIGDGSVWEEYRWTIYTRSGKRVGFFETFASYAPFFVSGSVLLYETRPFVRRLGGKRIQEPLRIRAVDLANGVEQWSVAVRDTAYNGPYPP